MEERSDGKTVPQYDPKHVRMGNWLDEYGREKNMLAMYRLSKKKRKLYLQIGVSPLFGLLLRPTLLRSDRETLKFGDVIQFVCDGLVLSIKVNNDDFGVHRDVPEDSVLTASTLNRICYRNSFVITDPGNKSSPGEVLHYGQDFAMATVDLPGVARRYAGADYPFGTLTKTPGHSLVTLFSKPLGQCRFKMERTVEPDLAEDTPVRPQEVFHLLSSPTNRQLVLNRRSRVICVLGQEKEVTFYYTPDWFTKFDSKTLINLWNVSSINSAP